MSKPEPKYGIGDLVVLNESKDFGNKEDKLFHIESIRYGTCTDVPKKQYWYSGNILKIVESKSKGLPQIPAFSTTHINAPEDELKGLESLL